MDIITSLPQIIDNQISDKIEQNNLKDANIKNEISQSTYYLSDVKYNIRSIPPSQANLFYNVDFINGKPVVKITVDHNFKDLTGHDIGRDIIAELYRDLNEDGVITSNELITSIKLDVSNVFIDTSVEKDKTYIYRILYKTLNGGQIWSEPFMVSTFDNTVYSKPSIEIIDNIPPDIEVITSNITNYVNDTNVNALVKIRNINDSNFDGFILKFKSYNSTVWEDIELSNTFTIDNYFYVPLKGLLKQHFYQLKVAYKRKTGTLSDWSDIITFSVGDIVTPLAPVYVDADNISTSNALKVNVKWVKDDRSNNIRKFFVYRHTYNIQAGAFVDNSKTLIAVVNVTDQKILEYNVVDNSVVNNKAYVYEIFASLDDNEEIKSTSKFSNLVLVTYIYDSPNITITYLQDQYHFPIKVDWVNFTPGNAGYYIKLYDNTSTNREALSMLVPPNTNTKIITLNDFTKESASKLTNITSYNINNNFTLELGKAIKDKDKIIYEKLGYETFTINPRPNSPTNFEAVYDPMTHRVDFKWTKSNSYSVKGYEIRLLDEANYGLWLTSQGANEVDYQKREQAWASGTVIANVKMIPRDRSTWSWQLPKSYPISPDNAIPLYFLIKTVGDVFIDTKLTGELENIIYSQEAKGDTTSIKPKLVAPTVDTTGFTSAVLEGDTIKLTWQYDENLYRQVDHFEVFMSDNASDLNNLNTTFRVWSGLSKTCVLYKDHQGNKISYAKKYYFRVVAVDRYGFYGVPSVIFSNYISLLKQLPKPIITGVGDLSPVRIVLTGKNYAPLYDSEILSFFKHRTVQFVIPEGFVKDIHVYAIRWYASYDGQKYVKIAETPFAKDIVDKSVKIDPGFKHVYTFPTDVPYLRIKATQVRLNGDESNVNASEPSDLAIIDTTPPIVMIDKILYSNNNTNAINKNGYINRNVLYGPLKVYYKAYEKDGLFPVAKVEYAIDNDVWDKVDLKNDYFTIHHSLLGPDTVNGIYRDITLKIRAFDIAGNCADTEVTFRKDTEGVPEQYRPTGFKYKYGKNLTIEWINPVIDNRNIYDGVKIFIGTNMETAKEYHTKSSSFVIPATGNSIDLYVVITDIADNYIWADFNGNYYNYPYKITISNAPPKAPENIVLESVPSGIKVKWSPVTKDINNADEDIKEYIVEYGIATSYNNVTNWLNAGSTPISELEIMFSDQQLDNMKQNPSLNCYVRVKAVDVWGLNSSWGVNTTGAKPKYITAVDMSNNVFNFELSFNNYISNVTGNTNDVLDADYDNNRYITITNNLAYEGYAEINLKKAEWVPNIKLKFYYPQSNIDFFIEYKTRNNNVDTWGNYLVPTTGNSLSSITKTTTKPSSSNPKFFRFTPSSSEPGDIAVLSCENIVDDKRPLFIIAMRVYFVTTGQIRIVELQPIIESMANIFYGSEMYLDDMIAIRSKRDTNNYVVLNKKNLTFYSTGNSIKSRFGEISTNVYGSWLKDGVYIGGSNYYDAPIRIEGSSASITLGGFYSNESNTTLGSGTSRVYATPSGIVIENNGLNSNSSQTQLGSGSSKLIATSSGITISNGGFASGNSSTTLGISGSQLVATASGIVIVNTGISSDVTGTKLGGMVSKLEATSGGITISNGGFASNNSSTTLGATGSQLVATSNGITITNTGISSSISGTNLGSSTSKLEATAGGITITQQEGTASWSNWTVDMLRFGTGSTVGSNTLVTLGKLATGVYGSWLKDGVYIGGSSYSNAPIKIEGGNPSISIGVFSSTNSSTLVGTSSSQLSATSSGIVITQQEGTASWSRWNSENLRFGTGSTIGSNVKAILGKLPDGTYGNWLADGSYIGGTSISNADIKISGGIIYLGYINSTTYNMRIGSSYVSMGWDSAASTFSTVISQYGIATGVLSGASSRAVTLQLNNFPGYGIYGFAGFREYTTYFDSLFLQIGYHGSFLDLSEKRFGLSTRFIHLYDIREGGWLSATYSSRLLIQTECINDTTYQYGIMVTNTTFRDYCCCYYGDNHRFGARFTNVTYGLSVYNSSNAITLSNCSYGLLIGNGFIRGIETYSNIAYYWAISNPGTGTALVIDTNGIIRAQSSSLRYKNVISKYNSSALDIIKQITPVIYQYIDNPKHLIGMVAEQVAEIEPSIVNFNKDGLPDSIDYFQLISLLVKAIKELDEKINNNSQNILTS